MIILKTTRYIKMHIYAKTSYVFNIKLILKDSPLFKLIISDRSQLLPRIDTEIPPASFHVSLGTAIVFVSLFT